MDGLRECYEYASRWFSSRLEELDALADCFVKAFQGLGDWVRGIRYARNLTQAKLAELVEVDTRTVQRWEANKQVPRGNSLFRMQQMDDKTSKIMGRVAMSATLRGHSRIRLSTPMKLSPAEEATE